VMQRPKRVQTSPNEGNILLALSAFQSGQCTSLYTASKMYNVPKNTLYRRMNGSTLREDYILNNKKLSYVKEEAIV
jgi:hypothetical protein